MARRKARRVFSKEFKLEVLREIDGGASVAQTARNHDVHPETIRLWRRTERQYGDRAFAGNGHAYTDEARIAQLERALGQATLEIAVLKKTLSVLKDQERKGGGRR
jgi:transposase